MKFPITKISSLTALVSYGCDTDTSINQDLQQEIKYLCGYRVPETKLCLAFVVMGTLYSTNSIGELTILISAGFLLTFCLIYQEEIWRTASEFSNA
jgi:hypothetical protein